jgi:phosphatidylinositol alpha-mannosyltransferase
VPIVSIGRTIGIPDNGSVQRVALSPSAGARTAQLVRRRGYDLVHLHEPLIPAACLTALLAARVPVVGTFHMVGATARGADRRLRRRPQLRGAVAAGTV